MNEPKLLVPTTSAAPLIWLKNRLPTLLGALASVLILCLALWFLHGELSGLSRGALLRNVREVPQLSLMAAMAFATLGYLVLTTYDALALRYIDKTLPYRRTALTSFMAYAVGHNVGFATFSGGAIRYRMYSLAGLSATEIAQLIAFITLTFFVGASGLLGLTFLTMPAAHAMLLKFPLWLMHSVGVVMLLVPVIYLIASVVRTTPLQIGDWQLRVPTPAIAVKQIIASVLDLTFAAATLYVLLEPVLQIGFLPFLGIYLVAMAAGLVSSIPGGIGVFEAVLVAALPQVEPAALIGPVIVYRAIYYLLPLCVALVFLIVQEFRNYGTLLQKSTATAGSWIAAMVPQAIGIAVFLAGVVLLLSGTSAPVEHRLNIVARAIPLPILELSHLLGSALGVGLLILARGLFRRLHGAYLVTLVTLAAGITMSLLKGLDYEEALLLGAIMVFLWFFRDEFYRQESLGSQRFSTQWITAIILVLCLAFWVGMISFRHVEYSDKLWWQFAFQAEAPRMLRASVVTAITALAFALWKIVRVGSKISAPAPLQNENELVRAVIATAKDSTANLALLGDKRFIWSADKQAFIMYQISGESWIAMGDPVGPTSCHEELVWKFRELVDSHDGRPVFYQVSGESLALFVDLGLSLAKLGEDGKVSLIGFSLQGSHRAEFRQTVNRAKKHGAVFEIVPSAEVYTIIPELRAVSDSWLKNKATAEKGFSLGAFSESYIVNFDCAVVRVEGRIVAFANLWPAPAGQELSIDLMRFNEFAPKSIMDYLFVEIMLWGAANNFHWFSLGMAPLSGLEQRSLAPMWHKFGHMVYSHGESFYNFEGLRHYKEKFDPSWQPRYLACPGGWLNLPRALLDSSRLISGSTLKILLK